jgi:predicted NBD/HSP70 family sugar kinase
VTRQRLDGRARVLTTLSRSGPLSQAELARRTVLAPSTVSGLVSDLAGDGLVVELEGLAPAAGSRGGRPASLLALHPDTGVVLGVDFGKTHVRVAVADLAHRVLGERYAALEADAPARTHIATAQELGDDLLAGAGISRDRVVGLGCGFPGPVRATAGGPMAGGVIDPTILPGWTGVSPVEALTDAFGTPVQVANDANLGALGEWMWGAARGCSEVAYLKVATGVGAGLVLRDQPFGGHRGTAGEIGHVSLDPGGPECRCGNRGCLELLAGVDAITARAGSSYAGFDGVLRAARGGDARCVDAIGGAGTWLGVALAMLCNVLDLERIVVGGDVAAAEDLLLDPLRTALLGAAMGSVGADVTVVAGALGERAEVLGAVAHALRSSTPLTG